MPPPDLKLATGLFVLLMLVLPALKSRHSRAPVLEAIRGEGRNKKAGLSPALSSSRSAA